MKIYKGTTESGYDIFVVAESLASAMEGMKHVSIIKIELISGNASVSIVSK